MLELLGGTSQSVDGTDVTQAKDIGWSVTPVLDHEREQHNAQHTVPQKQQDEKYQNDDYFLHNPGGYDNRHLSRLLDGQDDPKFG